MCQWEGESRQSGQHGITGLPDSASVHRARIAAHGRILAWQQPREGMKSQAILDPWQTQVSSKPSNALSSTRRVSAPVLSGVQEGGAGRRDITSSTPWQLRSPSVRWRRFRCRSSRPGGIASSVSAGESLPRDARSMLNQLVLVSDTAHLPSIPIGEPPSKSDKERGECTAGAFQGGSASPASASRRPDLPKLCEVEHHMSGT